MKCATCLLILLAISLAAAPIPIYPVHHNITATIFWVGESAADDKHTIANAASAWDDQWLNHFGGVDDPKHRKDYFPVGFEAKENPFYFALPYNDFHGGKRRPDTATVIPWVVQNTYKKSESMCKNHWIKITRGEKVCYAQWEDVGPFLDGDSAYVFGETPPKNKDNKQAGLDLSPAASEYLGTKGMDKVDWQFVEASDVPDGPWKTVVTTSQVDWK